MDCRNALAVSTGDRLECTNSLTYEPTRSLWGKNGMQVSSVVAVVGIVATGSLAVVAAAEREPGRP